MSRAKFVAKGFRHWAQRNIGSDESDELWNWVSDQLLAAQNRHAFAFGCIIFRRDSHGELETLLIRRQFSGFADRVFLWPGGRVRGLANEEALVSYIEALVEREARCSVRLVGPISRDENVTSITQDRKATIRNQISPPPFLIMRENRIQRNGVPGHVDLIFVADFRSAIPQGADGDQPKWLSLDQVRNFAEDWILWPDTQHVILRAASWYDQYVPKASTSAAV